jgi:hypothetical protein
MTVSNATMAGHFMVLLGRLMTYTSTGIAIVSTDVSSMLMAVNPTVTTVGPGTTVLCNARIIVAIVVVVNVSWIVSTIGRARVTTYIRIGIISTRAEMNCTVLMAVMVTNIKHIDTSRCRAFQ